MTVLIDEPMWWFRGRKWSHLVSDSTIDELHDFAQGLGIPRKAFQGYLYDVPQEYYEQMVEAGAVPTPSRELVRRLRASGLRLTPAARRLIQATEAEAAAAAATDAQESDRTYP